VTALAPAAVPIDARRVTAPPGPLARTAAVEEAIVLALFDLANQLVRRGDALAATAGLTTQQWLVLLQISGDPNFRDPAGQAGAPLPSEIARARGVTRATVSAVIAALKRRGLIQEQVDDADGRRRRLAVTAAGHAVIEQIQPLRRAANRRLLAGLDRDQRRALLRGLESCLDVLWGRPVAAPRAPRRRRAGT
jgi:DNA-binding MarR family transcriptional regulator